MSLLRRIAVLMAIGLATSIPLQARADWTASSYFHTTRAITILPANDDAHRGASATDTTVSAWSSGENAIASAYSTTYRNFSWSGPGWPQQVEIYFQAVANASASNAGTGTTQGTAQGTNISKDTSTNGNYSSDHWTFPSHVINTGGFYTGEMDIYASAVYYSASADLTANIGIAT